MVAADALLERTAAVVRETDVVVDIGCGLMPMNYFRPKLHFMIEPWKEYSDILSYRYRADKNAIILRLDALSAMKAFADKSADSIFVLDVIEHLPKDVGYALLEECDRVAREQIVIFTPLGFMPQHMGKEETDGWGLSGTGVQEHLSGWTPEDFDPNWTCYVSDDFHRVDFRGAPLLKPHGAFFAVKQISTAEIPAPSVWSDWRRQLPSEIELKKLKIQMEALGSENANLKAANREIFNSRMVRLAHRLHRLLASRASV